MLLVAYAISLLGLLLHQHASTMNVQRAFNFILLSLNRLLNDMKKYSFFLLLLFGSLDIVTLSPSHTVIICFEQPFIHTWFAQSLTSLHFSPTAYTWHNPCIFKSKKKSCTFSQKIK